MPKALDAAARLRNIRGMKMGVMLLIRARGEIVNKADLAAALN